MRKFLTALLLLNLVAGMQPLYAANEGDAGLSFWEKLRKKIESLAPQKKVSATTAVGGVRGAPVSADDTYWKGEKAAHDVDATELEEFQKAVQLAESGDTKQAQVAFADFVKKSPDSPLRPDAEQALAQLKSAK